jgi:hypothetical protein
MGLLLESVRRLLVRDGKARLYVAAGGILDMCATILRQAGRPWVDNEDRRQVDDAWRGTIPVVGVEPGNHR